MGGWHLSLSWSSLADGWCYLKVDGHHLFRHEQQDRVTWLRRALDRACDTGRAGARALVPVPPP